MTPVILSTCRLLGFLSLFALVGVVMATTLEYTSNVRTVSHYSLRDFTPDGDLEKAVWRGAEWVACDHDMKGLKRYPEQETRVASVWSGAHIYFAFRSAYTELNIYEGEDPANERWELWERDVVEIFLNPRPEHVNQYYEFEVAPNNQWIDLVIDKDQDPFNDASWDSGFEHATRIDERARVWTSEMKIPLAALGVKKIEPGAEWRVNYYRADGKGGREERRYMSWSTIPEGRTFHTPTRFGIIQFVK